MGVRAFFLLALILESGPPLPRMSSSKLFSLQLSLPMKMEVYLTLIYRNDKELAVAG